MLFYKGLNKHNINNVFPNHVGDEHIKLDLQNFVKIERKQTTKTKNN